MKHMRRFVPVVVAATGVCFSNGDASAQASRGGKPTFPKHVGAQFEYAGKQEGYPPRIRGAQEVRPIASRPLPQVLPPRWDLHARDTAVGQPEVQAALGERFVYVRSALIPREKAAGLATVAPPPSPPVIRVQFYSYSKRMAVEVHVRDQAVLRVIPRPDYMPPETAAEAKAAVALARADARLKEHVAGLMPRVLLSLPDPPGRPLPRILHVSFAAGEALDPEFDALVDIVAGTVLEARPLPKHP
jgi:hypothetical protein